MKLQLANKYTASKFAFPADNIPQSDKNKPEYFLHCANSIVSKYVRGKGALPYSYSNGKHSIEELRTFFRGTNSVEKYQNELLGPIDPRTGKRKTHMNISWEPPQILAEKMDVVKGYMMKLVYDVTTTAIDMQAKMDKETVEANLKLMVDDRMQLFGVQLNEAAGKEIVPQKQQGEIPFQSEKDVNMFSRIGGILLEQEIALKILLDESLMASDWKGIWDKLIEDLLTVGYIGMKSYVEVGCDTPKMRWVDMDRAIFGYSDYNDHRDNSYGGEIRQMTIAELRKESGLSDSDIKKIAYAYGRDEKSSQFMSDFYGQMNQGHANNSFGMSMIDSLVVDVADVCWIGTYSEKLTKVTRQKEGNTALNKVNDNYQLSEYSKKKGKELIEHTRQCVYKAKLVVGTDYVFDTGQEYNLSYRKNDQGKMEVILPYVFLKTGSISMVERTIPMYEDIVKATYKKRNAINKILPPPGIVLMKKAFDNVEVGGISITPNQNMKMLGESGYAVGDNENLWGQNNSGGLPIYEVPSGSNQQIAIFNNEIEFNVRQIERVTGINDIFSGATPNSSSGLGVNQIAVSGAMNAIYPLVRTLELGYEKILRVCAKQWQVSASHMDDKNRTKKAHDRALSYVKITKDIVHREFMINIQPGVTDQQKQELLADIRQLQDFRRQTGAGGIRASDYAMIYEMINAGQVKQARLVLSQVEEYLEKMDQANKDKLVQQNMVSQMQSNQQTAENEAQLLEKEIGLKGQSEAQVLQTKIQTQAQADLMLEQVKSQNALKLAYVQSLNKDRERKIA